MKYILFLLLFATSYSDVLRLSLDSRMTEAQRFTSARVQALYNTYVIDRGLPPEENMLNISIEIAPIDGDSGILAKTYANFWTRNFLNKYVLVSGARIEFDEDDINLLSQTKFSEILTHELAHCFGFHPIIWPSNGNIYAQQYIGQMALGGYKEEYNPFAQFVPTDVDHFDEMYMPLDLMSTVLDGNYISKTFWGVLADNGNTISPNVRYGPLSSILPRRPVEIIIIKTHP